MIKGEFLRLENATLCQLSTFRLQSNKQGRDRNKSSQAKHSSIDDEEDEIPLEYTYDYGGKAVRYNSNEDIEINIEEGSLIHNLQM